ncbi:hypothetical protein LPJ53_000732 [Coemansia erecta]|uniref:Uncharacterized protein n=1 Tax=Coemansia erecta TaxID=147472 RepID=A0A9W8CUV4_9FUNG|nr:hypothetical protein LPJ53_000732 [Coemansia erecta]
MVSKIRTQKWTRAEKDRLFESLKSGRVSIAKAAQCVGETKSLRQVAEYIEYLQLWSKLIDNMPPHKQEAAPRMPAPEAEESDGGSSSDMASDADEDCSADVCPEPSTAAISMFDQSFADLLAKMCTGDDDAAVDKSTYAALRSILTDFLSSVLKESTYIATISKGTNHADANSTLRLNLHKEAVTESLQACGYGEYMYAGDPARPMDRLIAEYLDDTVASALLPEPEPLSAAAAPSSDSEDSIGTSSDHD